MTRTEITLSTCADPVVLRSTVPHDWIDINGHMNVAFYTRAFDLGVDALWQELEITESQHSQAGSSTFAVACHIRYIRELFEDQPFSLASRMLAWDAKRLHHFQQIFHAQHGWLAATCEWLHLHVDLRTRKVTPWPAHVLEKFTNHSSAKSTDDRPALVGQPIRIDAPLGPIHRSTLDDGQMDG